MSAQPPPARQDIGAALARRLVAEQFPEWAGLPVRRVEPGGWDNRTFRLGEEMAVRLPSAECYAAQVPKEHRWLPRLAPHLPLPIPTPLAMGEPADGYPYHWSVYRWIDGEPASAGTVRDTTQLAADLARFLATLQRIDAAGGPPPGRDNFFRGAPPSTYDGETRRALAALHGEVDAVAAGAVWKAAVASEWQGPPVWFHGDVSAGNLLVTEGRLSAVIDFGISGVGDPACDLAIAWTLFSGESREAFRAGLPLDAATWARGRGWALWKALITLVASRQADPSEAARCVRVVDEVLADHAGAA